MMSMDMKETDKLYNNNFLKTGMIYKKYKILLKIIKLQTFILLLWTQTILDLYQMDNKDISVMNYNFHQVQEEMIIFLS